MRNEMPVLIDKRELFKRAYVSEGRPVVACMDIHDAETVDPIEVLTKTIDGLAKRCNAIDPDRVTVREINELLMRLTVMK